MSPIDDLFFQIFGYHPSKSGKSYEMLAAAATKLLFPERAVKHDVNLQGLLSETLYQLDVMVNRGEVSQFGEAKDYTERNAKVGRPDLQKLGGALPDLPVDGAIFYSATDFTTPAKAYAQNSEAITGRTTTPELDSRTRRKKSRFWFQWSYRSFFYRILSWSDFPR